MSAYDEWLVEPYDRADREAEIAAEKAETIARAEMELLCAGLPGSFGTGGDEREVALAAALRAVMATIYARRNASPIASAIWVSAAQQIRENLADQINIFAERIED